jgi:hypothetical protein
MLTIDGAFASRRSVKDKGPGRIVRGLAICTLFSGGLRRSALKFSNRQTRR